MTAPDRPLPLLRDSGHSHANWKPGVDLVLAPTMQIIVLGHDDADRACRAPSRAVPFAAQPADRVLRAAHARIHSLATAAIEAKAEDEEDASRRDVQVRRRVLLLGELARHVNQRGKGRHRVGRLLTVWWPIRMRCVGDDYALFVFTMYVDSPRRLVLVPRTNASPPWDWKTSKAQ